MSFVQADGSAALLGDAGSGRVPVYRRALRHSRRVRQLRVGLIAGIAALLAGLVALNYLPSIGGLTLPVEIGKVVIKGTKITMQQPHLTGYTSDARAYEFTAKSAAQDITKPDFVELQDISAQMEMADKSTVHMWADTGLYSMKGDQLTLNDDIRLVSSTGYEARLSHAVIDMTKGDVVSDAPVWVKLLEGSLKAQRLEIVDKGDIVRFSGVSMTLLPNKAEAAKDESGKDDSGQEDANQDIKAGRP